MEKQSQIKWRKSDKEEIVRLVKNANAKIYRNKGKDNDKFLPDKWSVKDLKKDIKTRTDFNRVKEDLISFLKRDSLKLKENKYGIKATLYELRTTERHVKEVNKKRKQERKIRNIDENDRSDKAISLRERKFNFEAKKSRKEWEMFRKAVDKEIGLQDYNERYENYKRIYLEQIDNFLGSDGLIRFIKTIDAKTLYEAEYQEDDVLKISFTSDPIATWLKIEEITSRWRKNLNLEKDKDFYEFIGLKKDETNMMEYLGLTTQQFNEIFEKR